jgi:hypothetical protein
MKYGLHFHIRLLANAIIVICCLSGVQMQSQNTGVSTKYDSTFNSFKNSITSDFERYQAKNDSLFIEFLQNAWKDYNVMKDSSSIKIKPKVQPRVQALSPEKTINKMDTMDEFKGQGYEIHNNPIPEKNSYRVKATSSFDFYGEKSELPEISVIHLIMPIDNFNIISFYRSYLKDPNLNNIAVRMKSIAKSLKLNDFGYYLLIQKASQTLFNAINDQVLYTWVSLLRSGLDVKVGYNKNDITLLMNCDNALYNTNFVNVGGSNYYLLYFPGQDQNFTSVQTYNAEYPGKINPVSIQMKELPTLTDSPVQHKYIFNHDTIKVDINLFLIEYLANYPACRLNLYFNTPFSNKVVLSLDHKLSPLLSGKSEISKINTLLSFIQKSFPYKTDQEQFGKEKYMFCDEAVYYPFTDCDDRSVLLARLVKHFMGLETIGLDYPDHVSVGVKLSNPIKGDYVDFNNSRFFICDPTYIGAKAGMAMDEMKTSKPEVILINN